MLMLWEDLLPGDKIRFTREARERYYNDRMRFKILEISKVDCFSNKIQICFKNGFDPIIINRDGTFYFDAFNLFEIVELVED